jgi:hypothetical protein
MQFTVLFRGLINSETEKTWKNQNIYIPSQRDNDKYISCNLLILDFNMEITDNVCSHKLEGKKNLLLNKLISWHFTFTLKIRFRNFRSKKYTYCRNAGDLHVNIDADGHQPFAKYSWKICLWAGRNYWMPASGVTDLIHCLNLSGPMMLSHSRTRILPFSSINHHSCSCPISLTVWSVILPLFM